MQQQSHISNKFSRKRKIARQSASKFEINTSKRKLSQEVAEMRLSDVESISDKTQMPILNNDDCSKYLFTWGSPHCLAYSSHHGLEEKGSLCGTISSCINKSIDNPLSANGMKKRRRNSSTMTEKLIPHNIDETQTTFPLSRVSFEDEKYSKCQLPNLEKVTKPKRKYHRRNSATASMLFKMSNYKLFQNHVFSDTRP